jgi:hypothetical protein
MVVSVDPPIHDIHFSRYFRHERPKRCIILALYGLLCCLLAFVASDDGDGVAANLHQLQHELEGKWKLGACDLRDIGSILSNLQNFYASTRTLVQTPCFDLESLGNMLSYYIEGRLCAEKLSLNYVGVHMIDPDPVWSNIVNHSFFKALPNVVAAPVASSLPTEQVASLVCKCRNVCHEAKNGLIHANWKVSRDIFAAALNSYWIKRTSFSSRHLEFSPHVHDGGGATIIARNGTVSEMKATDSDHSLPLIPDVAIHYRCGDNFVGHYGFLPFWVIADRMPATAVTIYIMAENPLRKTLARSRARVMCDALFEGLMSYLAKAFPRATIVLLRGHDIFEDLARLTYAATTICSVSTYCFFPALANNNTAYFPASGLIAEGGEGVMYGPSFNWIPSKYLHLAQVSLRSDPAKFIEQMSTPLF